MSSINRTSRIVTIAALAASTALSGPIAAFAQDQAAARVRLAQAEEEPVLPPENEAPAEEAPAEAPAAEEPPAEEPAAEEPAAEEPAQEAPAAEEPAAEEPAQEEPAAEEPPADEPPTEEPAAAEEPAAEEPAQEEPAAEEPPTEEPAAAEEPAAEEPAAEEPAQDEPAAQEEPAAEQQQEPAAEEAAPAEEPAAEPSTTDEPAAEQPQAEEPAASEAPSEQPQSDAPAAQELRTDEPAAPAEAPTDAAPAATPEPEAAPSPEAPAATTVPESAPATESAPAGEVQPVAPGTETPAPTPEAGSEGAARTAPQAAPDAAPAQAAPAAEGAATLAAPPPPTTPPEPVAAEIQESEVAPGTVAASDARVQNIEQNITINSVTNVEGTRIEQPPVYQLPPQVQQVERTDDDRQILTIIGAGVAGAAAGAAASYFIRSNDENRLRENSQEYYVEELPRAQTRETIVRDNGVQVVTIYDRYGEVVQRSRILPDGREVVLFYDPYADDEQGQDYYYDVGAELPPVRLTIPEDAYIVDVAQPDEDLYYRTIVAPPVETVERIYSVDEVRRSKRIRDKVRRIDLATINFDFGSYSIPQSQVTNLQALADAIARVIDENPDETFLIEGHTDAVGSEVANLTLSDRRAEAVAQALTSFFDVPPENLVTQGYGEADLKVNTQEPNAENRRVTVRRITALVKPVESASRN